VRICERFLSQKSDSFVESLELLTISTTFNMSGSEVAGLLMGAIPLVLLAFGRIRATLTEYVNIDRNLQSVLRNVKTAEGIFKATVNELLSEVAGEDMRIKILEFGDSESSKSTLQTLDDDLRHSLGMTYQAFKNSIHGFQDRMIAIERILGVINLDIATLHPGPTSGQLAITPVEIFHNATSTNC
jgi:hypothetical protein